MDLVGADGGAVGFDAFGGVFLPLVEGTFEGADFGSGEFGFGLVHGGGGW